MFSTVLMCYNTLPIMLICKKIAIIFCVVPVLTAVSKQMDNEKSLRRHFYDDPQLKRDRTSYKMKESPYVVTKTNDKNATFLWPNNTVIYQFGKYYTQKQKDVILETMKYIERASDHCVKFKSRTYENGFVNFTVSIKYVYHYIALKIDFH